MVLRLIAILPFILVAFLMVIIFNFVFTISSIATFTIAIVFLIASLYLVPAFIVFPLYGYLGAWDDRSIDDFRKAALMSGPSKKIVNLFYRSTKFGYYHSPWKGKYIVPHELSDKEAQELTLIRKELELKVKR